MEAVCYGVCVFEWDLDLFGCMVVLVSGVVVEWLGGRSGEEGRGRRQRTQCETRSFCEIVTRIVLLKLRVDTAVLVPFTVLTIRFVDAGKGVAGSSVMLLGVEWSTVVIMKVSQFRQSQSYINNKTDSVN